MKRSIVCATGAALLVVALSGCVAPGAQVPEFDREQSNADALPHSDNFDASPYDASSTRFIAEQEGWQIYIARTASDMDSQESCVLLFRDEEHLAQCDDTFPVSVKPDGESFTVSLAGPQGPQGSEGISDSVYISAS